jgi:hypothetical protein
VVNLLKLGYSHENFTPRIQSKEKIYSSWPYHVEYRSDSPSTYDMIIFHDLLGESGIVMNFNDWTVTWDTDTISMKEISEIHAL